MASFNVVEPNQEGSKKHNNSYVVIVVINTSLPGKSLVVSFISSFFSKLN